MFSKLTSRCTTVAAVLLTFTLAGCPPQPPTQAPLKQKLVAGGKFAENTLYACLLNGLAQGLPIKLASDECATKLLDEPKEGGVGGIPGLIGGNDPFDPASVQGNCSVGDPARGQTNSDKPVGYPASGMKGYGWTKVGGMEGFGYASYGGKGKTETGDDGQWEYVGLSKEESEARKKEAIDAALKALEKHQAARDAADKEKDPAKKKALDKEAKAAEKEWEAAHSEATKDPNKKRGDSKPASVSLCEQTLQAARQILFECNRTGWKTAQCQSLAAKMNHCPDPKYIYIDPEAGYSCGEKIDPKAVKDAWSARCEQLIKYGPGGTNPCQVPVVNGDGRFVEGRSSDICRDPRAYVDADSGACITTLEAKSPSGAGQPSVQELIVWALDNIGGPIVVLPHIPKPEPRPGTGPRPEPR